MNSNEEYDQDGKIVHTCTECGEDFTTWPDDTAESGECFGHPEMCWSCGWNTQVEVRK